MFNTGEKGKINFRTTYFWPNLPSDSASSIIDRPGKYRRTWCSSSIAAECAAAARVIAHSLPVKLAERPPSGLPMSSSSNWSRSHDDDTEDSGATSKKLTRRRCRRWGEDGTTPCGGGWTARVTRRVRDGGGSLVSSSRVASSRNSSSTFTALNDIKEDIVSRD